jgi:hypothetical protein
MQAVGGPGSEEVGPHPAQNHNQGRWVMSIIDRLRAAYAAFQGEEDAQECHRYGIVIGDSCYLADSYTIDPYSGDPEWDYTGLDGAIHCKKVRWLDTE